jgi:hypothetical protein
MDLNCTTILRGGYRVVSRFSLMELETVLISWKNEIKCNFLQLVYKYSMLLVLKKMLNGFWFYTCFGQSPRQQHHLSPKVPCSFNVWNICLSGSKHAMIASTGKKGRHALRASESAPVSEFPSTSILQRFQLNPEKSYILSRWRLSSFFSRSSSKSWN